MKIEERIVQIKEEIKATPYHKGTEHHIGKLRARLTTLKARLEQKYSRGGGRGFAIKKSGDATVVLVGPPSAGKSTLINQLTSVVSKVGYYDFTTLTVIPGMLEYQGAKIQILDIPGLLSGASRGKGRGREVLSVIKIADLLLLMIDFKNLNKIKTLKKELDEADISSVPYFVVVSKIDELSRKKIKKIKEKIKTKKMIFLSSHQKLGLQKLKQAIWQKLDLIRVYLKEKGKEPDFEKPFIMKKNQSLKDLIKQISICEKADFEAAEIYGSGAKFPGQIVSLNHQPQDQLIITFLSR